MAVNQTADEGDMNDSPTIIFGEPVYRARHRSSNKKRKDVPAEKSFAEKAIEGAEALAIQVALKRLFVE